MADVVYFDGGISIPFCPPTVNGIYISGSGCCSEFYSAFIGGNQTYNLTYTLPTASGTSGQVLTNDGNGNLSWTTVSGGGGAGNPAGTDGMIQYNNGGIFGGSTLLFWNDGTNRLGFNTSSPAQSVDIQGTLRLSNVTGVAETLMGRNSSGDVAGISVGSGLSLSGNTISFTGSTGGGTGTVTGTGTTNYLSKWSSASGLTNSIILETGNTIDITGALRVTTASGTATTIAGQNNNGYFSNITVGSGLSLSGNILSTTGVTAGTVTGTGTTNYITKWLSSSGITDSIILETGNTIDINGSLRVRTSSGTATAVMGRDANGYVSNLSLGNGLSISGGTLSFTGSTGVSGNFVPYLGATGNTDLGGYGIAGSYFQLSTSTGGTLVPGMFSWNGSDGTADLMLKGGTVTLPIGETQLARVINETGANLLKSQYRVVRVNGSTGTRLKVALALASGDATSVETLGIVAENITLSQEGFVITSGLIKGINTTGSLQAETWSDGDMLFLSPFVAGALTNIKPQAPNHLVVMGYVVTAANNGVIYVKVDNGYELDELHNVLISSAATNNILAYDGVTGVWRNRTASSLNLVSGSGVTGIVPRWASSSGLTDSVIFSTGTVVGINTTNPQATLDVRGTMRLTGSTGSPVTAIMGRDGSGDIGNVGVGTGLQLTNGTLSLTGATGTGTTNYLSKWASATGLTDSIVLETGNTIDIAGSLRVRTSSGTATAVMGRDVNGYVSNITTGAGLQLTNGTLFLTGATGTGTTGIVPRWASSSGLTDSVIFSTGTVVGINTTSPAQTLDIRGTMRLTGSTGDSTTIMGRNASGDVSAISIGSGLSLSGNTLSTTGSTGVSGSGTATQVAFWGGTSGSTSTALTSSTGLTWDNTNVRLGIGSLNPSNNLVIRSLTPTISSEVIGFSHSYSNTVYTRPNSNGSWSLWSGVNGGSLFVGISKGSSTPSIAFFGATDETSVSISPIVFCGAKRNSSTNDTQAVSSNERVISFYNAVGGFGLGTLLQTMFGDGSVLMSSGTFALAKLHVVGSGNTSGNAFLVQNSTPTNLLQVINNGDISFGTALNWNATNTRLGIGTASPSARLHVVGSGTTTGTTLLLQNSGSTNTFAVLDNGQIGVNTATPNTSSIFQIDSTTLGFLPPRMSTTQKTGIASPAQGLVVYDTTMQALSAYNGSNWATVGGGEQMFTITGSTATINFNAGNIADITLATSTTLTLTGGTFGTFIIKLTQDATGGRVVSWPSNVRWSGGIPPSLTTTGGKVDVISLIFDGTNYYGTYALNF